MMSKNKVLEVIQLYILVLAVNLDISLISLGLCISIYKTSVKDILMFLVYTK
jgi:hypothetical protein